MRTRRSFRVLIAAVASLALLAACGQEDADGDGSDPGTIPDVTTSTPDESATTTEAPVATPAPQSVIDQSIALLAEQLGVSTDEIEVANAVEVTWRDGSIGCAKKGMAYTDALVPGSMVELVVGDKTYEFHQGQNQPPFYCAKPTDPLPEA